MGHDEVAIMIEYKSDEEGVGSTVVYFTFLRGTLVGNRGATSLGKNLVPELGEAPCDGEDDALAYQNTEHICCDLSAISARIKEVVSFV